MAPLNFRKEFRELARRAQAENQRRLIAGTTVAGGPVAPLAESTSELKGGLRKKKVRARVAGARVTVSGLGAKPGVRTGAMLRDAVRASNIKVRKNGFKIIPAGDHFVKWHTFNAGRKPGKAQGARIASRQRVNARRAARGQTLLPTLSAASRTVPKPQPARPISGLGDQFMRDAADLIARAGRDQAVKALQGRGPARDVTTTVSGLGGVA